MNRGTLQQTLLATVAQCGGKLALADSGGAKVTFGEALQKCVFLAGRLRNFWEGQKMVGILVPPSVGGALLNWTALLMGKVPVNLNYTLSPEGIASCIEQCGITDVVVSGKLMKKLNLELPVRTHVLEDLVLNPKLSEKLKVGMMTKLSSTDSLLKKLGGDQAKPDDLATVIFSSGSTGQPKGVMLSHRNIISNVEQVSDVYSFVLSDWMLGVLPFFHSFGFMATIAGPAVSGFGCAYHFNPMEAKVIGPMAGEFGVTIMIATPTFLQFYLRGIEPEQLHALRLVVVGAEKLPLRVADAFEKKFGCRPFEAYGCTECSPGVALNGPGQNRVGSIGRVLRDMQAKVVNPENGDELSPGQQGLLRVKGPNVMQGYLGMEEKTAEVLKDGWYDTGDIVRIDDDGYLWIEGRLSRFSKIGGEMVPHGNVEQTLNELAGDDGQVFAVTGVPDDKKGERLVVVHTADEQLLEQVLNDLKDASIPNLWKPRRDQFIAVSDLPYLGSGKLDLKGLQQIAQG
ncbi:AMP-binding protein [Haloferula rosea]|uniref:AMP-binding protein n=1 Tax=Haloferula rosea TaxID=490093 RepID=A0A934RHX6_9BACT|nr:AMP-binding protein [Haloferula rosea]MBK1828630.1 AMP-binding protein [Haloferula rosea]